MIGVTMWTDKRKEEKGKRDFFFSCDDILTRDKWMIAIDFLKTKAVYDAWWKSEDNRPKLFEKRLNRVGVGIVNGTWTVVVGSTYDYRSKFFIVD